MRFILQQKHIISGITTYVIALFLCLAMISTASASVCFLPDGLDCAEGDTSGFWPGHNPNITDCDASYNSTTSRNACGVACERCNDRNSQYNGLFKCPPSTCNCNGFNDTNSVNECGDSCERCTITGDRNYGKYKCPDTRRACDDCNYTEEQAAQYMADDHCMECEPCNSNCCKGKWRCSVNKKCQQCRSEGYTLHKDSTELDELMNPSNNCSRYRCDPCPYDDEGDGQNWYKCGELDGQCDASYYQYSPDTLSTYTQTQINNHCDNECGICFDPRYGYKHCSCFGYDKRESDCTREGLIGYNKCNGHNGEWFEKCCSACSGYTYESDISDSNNGISCSKCENSCPNVTKKWKCLCSRTARCSAVNYPDTAAKTGAGWKSTSCTDCSGTYYKNECDTANGYSLQGGACVKSNTEYHFLFNDDGDGDDDYTTSKVTLRSSSSYVEVESYADTYSNNIEFTYSCTGDFDLDRSQTHWDTSNNEFQFVTKTTPTRGDTAVCTFTQNGSGKKITLKLDVACPAGWKETACSSDQIQTDYADSCYKCDYIKCYVDADEFDIDGYLGEFHMDGIDCDDGKSRATPGDVTFKYNLTRRILQANGNDHETGLRAQLDIKLPAGSTAHNTSNVTMDGKVYNYPSGTVYDIFQSGRPDYDECAFNYLHQARWWCCTNSCGINMQTDYACDGNAQTCYYNQDSVSATFGSGFSSDGLGHYSTDSGKKIYWKIMVDDQIIN